MQYSQTLLDDIRAAVDIVDLVSRFVNLRKAGSHWKGLCPFHAEKTPSFTVNPQKGIFHCFGCGVGGDAFGFVMRQDRLSFPEAVRALAKSTGVALPDERGATSGDSGREELIRVMELAGRFYVETLWKPAGERARAYLEQRGIDTEIARRFGLGYAPEGWESLLTFMKGEKVAEDALIAAGLAVARENRAGAYDRFRGRLLFPIRDLQGRVVAFGGRGFGDEQPKYLNSPETPLYTKGNLLYAADLARPTIQSQNRALLVEGYVDCIMAHQYGFTGTVAALGTAFTPAQLALLRRYCDEVVTFFDADAAGQKAAARAEELLEPTGRGMAWAVNRSGSVRGRRDARGEGGAASGGPRPGHVPAIGRQRGLQRADRRGPQHPVLRARPGARRSRRGHRDAGADHGVRAGGAAAGEGRRRGRGGGVVARGRDQARGRPDPALDRGPAPAVLPEDAAGAVSAAGTGLHAPGRAGSGDAPASLRRGPGDAPGAAGRAGRGQPRLAPGDRGGAPAPARRRRPRA